MGAWHSWFSWQESLLPSHPLLPDQELQELDLPLPERQAHESYFETDTGTDPHLIVISTVEEKELDPLSQTSRDFVVNPVSEDLETVPGIGPAGTKLLKKEGVTSTCHLVGQFFLCNCDSVEFVNYLTREVGINLGHAGLVAHVFDVKFRSLREIESTV